MIFTILTTLFTPEILIPPNLDINTSTNRLTITYRWRAVKHYIIAMFALICNGYNLYLTFLYTIVQVDVVNNSDLSALGLFILLGLVAAYYVLAGLVNRTTIQVTPNRLQVTHGPLPYFGNINLLTENISQIYVAEVFTKYDRRTTGYQCDLRVQPKSGTKDITLIKGIDTPLSALYLEQEIEHYLGIKDTIVPQESNKNGDPDKEVPRSWKALAQTHDFKLIVGKRLETTSITGVYNGYSLGLSAFRKDYPSGVLHTRVVLSANTPRAASKYPSPQNVMRLMDQINQALGAEELSHMKGKINGSGQKIIYEQPGIETRAKRLIYLFNSLGSLLDAYPYMVSLGGEAIMALKQVAIDKNHRLSALTSQWIKDIARQTHRLQNQPLQLVCQLCMVHCTAHEVELSRLNRVSFFGCRECFQSQDFYVTDYVVAVLDTSAGDAVQNGDILRVNWLKHGTLFDFDSVEIIHATDEDVERFAVQVGNDTLPARAAQYRQMQCTISCNCHLSENTRRILNKTFGHIKDEGPSTFPSDIGN